MLTKESQSYYDSFARNSIAPPDSSCSINDGSIGIVLVNWNSWGETIECLSAVSNMISFDGPVVVCDNASSDGSVAHIEAWANGRLCAICESDDDEIVDLVRVRSAALGAPDIVSVEEIKDAAMNKSCARLTIIESNKNLGFGAGSNIGIRFLEKHSNVKWYWLLNCDALPANNAFIELQAMLPLHNRPVICGTTLLEYSHPRVVQSCGAEFNQLLCSMKDNIRGRSIDHLARLSGVLLVDYPVGASVLVNRAFIESVGYLREDYFLYFEEIDWVMRFGWPSKAFIIVNSRVYHKGGATTGAGSSYRERALSADYFFLRSRILFARRFGRMSALTIILVSLVSLVRRAILFDLKALKNAVKALYAGFRMSV